MNLKCMMLTEKSQIQNGIYYMIPLTGHSQKDKTTGIKKKLIRETVVLQLSAIVWCLHTVKNHL